MTENDTTPGRADRITLTFAAFALAAWLVVSAMNGVVELGAVAHDAFCPEHGWAV